MQMLWHSDGIVYTQVFKYIKTKKFIQRHK